MKGTKTRGSVRIANRFQFGWYLRNRKQADEPVNEPERWTDRQTDGRTDAYVAFRVYYFVGGWSREVRSAVLVADSISGVHALLNAVILRKEVVDFSLHLSPSHPSIPSFSFALSFSFHLAVYRLCYPSLLFSVSLCLSRRSFGLHNPRLSFFRGKRSEKRRVRRKKIEYCYVIPRK